MRTIRHVIHGYRHSFDGLSREVWLLSLVMLVNRAGMMVLPFLSVYLHNAQGFSLRNTGIAMACFGLGSIAGSWLGGLLTDRVGFYRVQMVSLLLSSGMFLVLIAGTSFLFFCFTLFGLSLITDTFRPATLTAVGAFSRMENRTRSLSLVRMAVNLGFAIGPAIGGFLITWYGYNSIFYVNAVAMLVAAMVMYFTLAGKTPRNETGETEELVRPDPKSVFSDAPFMLLVISMLLTVVAFIQLLSTIPVYFKDLGFNEDAIGLFMAYNCMLVVVFEMPLIYFLERRYSLHILMALGAILITIGYLSLNVIPVALFAVLLYMTGISFGEIVTFPTANSQALQYAGPGQSGKYMGIFTMTFSVAFVLAPSMGMFVAEAFGFQTLWYISGVIGLLGAVGFILLGRFGKSPIPVTGK